MKYRYAKEKLRTAIRYLALGEGDVRDRLCLVSKVLFRLHAEHLPVRLVKDLVWVHRELTKYGPVLGKNGDVFKNAVDHTMERIRNSTGRRIAERIYNIWVKVEAS